MENESDIKLMFEAEKEMNRNFTKTQMAIFFKGLEMARRKQEQEDSDA